MTLSGSVSPSGETEIAVMDGAVTVTVVDPETLFSVAVIDAEPAATPVTTPEASTLALETADDVQVTRDVRSALLPSV